MKGLSKGMFPYRPDLLMGYEGQKVGIFVLNDDKVMRDTHKPCGFTAGRMRLVESAHKLANKSSTGAIKSVALPVRSVVEADLANYKLNLRKEFNIDSFLEQSGLKTCGQDQRVDTNLLPAFSAELTARVAGNVDSVSAKCEEFLLQLLNVMQ